MGLKHCRCHTSQKKHKDVRAGTFAHQLCAIDSIKYAMFNIHNDGTNYSIHMYLVYRVALTLRHSVRNINSSVVGLLTLHCVD